MDFINFLYNITTPARKIYKKSESIKLNIIKKQWSIKFTRIYLKIICLLINTLCLY